MKNSQESRQLINNELRTRGANQRVKKVLDEHTPEEVKDDLRIDFYCECSDPACNERLGLTLAEYDKMHNSEALFVVAKGHQSPTVEKVEQRIGDNLIVKKFAL